MPNRVDLVVHYLACFKAGLIATPLNYRYTARRDRPRARGERRPRRCSPTRSGPRTSPPASWPPASTLGTIAYRDAEPLPQGNEEPAAADAGWDHDFATLLAAEPLPRATDDADPTAPAVIFFTSGSTGPAKGVTHTRETLRWMIASAADRLRARRRGRLPARLLDVPRRQLPLGAGDALGRRPGRRRPRHRRPRAAAAAARAAADRAGDDPGGALGADPRPRPAPGRLRLAADLPRRRRQGLDRAAHRVRRRARASRSSRATG